MPQITHGIRAILSNPAIYRLFHKLVGASAARAVFVNEYVRPEPQNHILDVGCGPGDILEYLPASVSYEGFDMSPEYIQAARERFGHRATFTCEGVGSKSLREPSSFDIVITYGVIHHLDDGETLELLSLAHSALKPGGRFVSIDSCFTDDQSTIARYLVSKDRGQMVRTPAAYSQLIGQVFPHPIISVRHDLINIPYTNIIFECQR